MGRRKIRRQQHGSAWHWQQTDCWYYTMPGTKSRVALFDEAGERIRGRDSQAAAEAALNRIRLAGLAESAETLLPADQWLVANVCSEYIQYCQRGVANGAISKGHLDGTVSFLNNLCRYCGAMRVVELKKGHITAWLQSRESWKSSATHRSVLSVVLAAFNYAEEMFRVASPLKGLKKPASVARLQSFSAQDEQALYRRCDKPLRDFLFAAIHTGLRPFCELAKLTADDVVETDRGMMWRVYSSKTEKTRKIPVRPEVAELVHELVKTAPPGSGIPVFRNSRGKGWTKSAGVVRFLALKKDLGWSSDPVRSRYASYTCRHTFAHRMLSGYWNGGLGCSIETLAELIGDTPKVAFDHYGREWGQHYQEPLWAAVGSPGRTKGKAPARRRKPSGRKRKRSLLAEKG
jgi:integrase